MFHLWQGHKSLFLLQHTGNITFFLPFFLPAHPYILYPWWWQLTRWGQSQGSDHTPSTSPAPTVLWGLGPGKGQEQLLPHLTSTVPGGGQEERGKKLSCSFSLSMTKNCWLWLLVPPSIARSQTSLLKAPSHRNLNSLAFLFTYK